MSKTVHLLGLSSEGDLSLESRRLAEAAEVLAGPERLLALFPQFAGQKLPLTGPLNQWLREISALARDRTCAVLASGDPLFFGMGQKLLSLTDPEQVQIRPSLTSVQMAYARWKRSWAQTDTISLHGRPGWRQFWAALYRAGQRERELAVFTDPQNTPALIAQKILARDLENISLAVFEDLASPAEKISFLTPSEAAHRSFSPLNLLVLKFEKPPLKVILGSAEEDYSPEGGLITKSEIRLAALGLLKLTGSETLWDIGAGSGSVAAEAARLLEDGELWALEKNPRRTEIIAQNRRRFGLAHLEIVLGQAPDNLDRLPDPDRIFAGGGGPLLGPILEICLDRLRAPGLIVTAAIDPGHLQTAAACLSRYRKAQVLQLAVSRSQELGEGYYLKALNPVYLILGRKP